jgi:hypothetical protein
MHTMATDNPKQLQPFATQFVERHKMTAVLIIDIPLN